MLLLPSSGPTPFEAAARSEDAMRRRPLPCQLSLEPSKVICSSHLLVCDRIGRLPERMLSTVHFSFHWTHCRLPAEGISTNVIVNGENFVIPDFDAFPFMDGMVPSASTLNCLPLSSTVGLKRSGDERL
jgi:hypothetical protein